jgi:hypothetical protein
VLRGRFAGWKTIHWVLLGLTSIGLTVIAGAGLLLAVLASSLDSDRDLADFASQAEARDFASAHLPTALPGSAVVEALRYERFTDWRLTSRIRFDSSESVDRYVEQLERERKLDDAYCGDAEPSGGARYFLPALFACGTVGRGARAGTLEMACNTR